MDSNTPSLVLAKGNPRRSFRILGVFGEESTGLSCRQYIQQNLRLSVFNADYRSAIVELVKLIGVRTTILICAFHINNVEKTGQSGEPKIFQLHILDDPAGEIISQPHGDERVFGVIE